MKIPLINMILFFIAIQAMLVLVNTHDIDTPATLMLDGANATNYSTSTSMYGITTTSKVIWDTIIFPQHGTGSPFFTYLIIFAGLIAAIALVARIDTGVWSGMFIILLGFGALPIANLYNFINSEVGRFACTAAATVCWPSEFMAMLVCGILSIFWVWGCISWWSNRYD